jgi:hypothetical protein
MAAVSLATIEVAEDWLRCPRCHAAKFTYEWTEYGFEVACFRCPTYIGVQLVKSQRQQQRTGRAARWLTSVSGRVRSLGGAA